MGRLTFLERSEIQNIAYAMWLLDAFFKYVAMPVWFGCTVKVWWGFEGPADFLELLNAFNMAILTCVAAYHSLLALIIIPGFLLCNKFITTKMQDSFDRYYPEYTPDQESLDHQNYLDLEPISPSQSASSDPMQIPLLPAKPR